MSTVMKHGTRPFAPAPAKKHPDDEQLRQDRWTAAVVVVAVFALMALIIWLASLSDANIHEGVDYWHLMP